MTGIIYHIPQIELEAKPLQHKFREFLANMAPEDRAILYGYRFCVDMLETPRVTHCVAPNSHIEVCESMVRAAHEIWSLLEFMETRLVLLCSAQQLPEMRQTLIGEWQSEHPEIAVEQLWQVVECRAIDATV